MVLHHRGHGPLHGTAQDAAASVAGRAMVGSMEMNVQLRAQTTGARGGRGRSTCCHCQDVLTCEKTAFQCSTCHRRQHWACTGHSEVPVPTLPCPMCTHCLRERRLSPAACGLASLGRAMAQSYIEAQGFRVHWIDPDGWCLLACVAQAVQELGDRTRILRLALECIRDKMAFEDLSVSFRRRIKRSAAQLLGNLSAVDDRIGEHCVSDLWDFMPLALSRVSGRPLHILSGDVSRGRVSAVIVDETERACGTQLEPIVLIRSCSEYNCAHYDLVSVGCSVAVGAAPDAVATS